MRILLVEDNARVVVVVTRVLKEDAHTVVSVGTMRAAVAAAADTHHDLAIIDVGLPDGSGIDLCRTLRAEGNSLPVLLLTARTGVDDRVLG